MHARARAQVDVFSVGVIFYQMLFGRRPFGEGCSQERLLRDDIMANARSVAFPAKPSVSAEAKEFICRCARGAQGFRVWGARCFTGAGTIQANADACDA